MTNGYEMNAVSLRAAAKPSAQVKPKITVSLRLRRGRSSRFDIADCVLWSVQRIELKIYTVSAVEPLIKVPRWFQVSLNESLCKWCSPETNLNRFIKKFLFS